MDRRPDPARPPLAVLTEAPEKRAIRAATSAAVIASRGQQRLTREEAIRRSRESSKQHRKQNRMTEPAIVERVVAYLRETGNAPRTTNSFRELLGITARIEPMLERDPRLMRGPYAALKRNTYQLTLAAVMA